MGAAVVQRANLTHQYQATPIDYRGERRATHMPNNRLTSNGGSTPTAEPLRAGPTRRSEAEDHPSEVLLAADETINVLIEIIDETGKVLVCMGVWEYTPDEDLGA